MSYDPTNPTQVAQLKALVVDPALPTVQNLALINDPALNTAPDTGAEIFTARVLVNASWDASVASQDQFKVQLLIETVENIDVRLSEFRLRAIALSAQLGNAITAQVRDLSLGEVTFGVVLPTGEYEEIFITEAQLQAALAS